MEWKRNCSVRGLDGYHLALLWQANPSALERVVIQFLTLLSHQSQEIQ